MYSVFVTCYDQIFPFRETTYQFLCSYLNVEKPAILDIGCGTGSYIERLASSAETAVGIDLEPDMIKFAAERYSHAAFHCLDMWHIDQLQDTFDLIYSVGNVIPHLSVNRLSQFIMKVHQQLNSKGIWLFQTVNWDFILTQDRFSFPEIRNEAHHLIFLREYPAISKELVVFKTRLLQHQQVVMDSEVTLYPQTAQQYISLHEQTGFSLNGHFADFQKTPYQTNKNSGNILVFQKQ